MRILGIDCGTERTGWGVIESDGRRHQVLGHGVIRTKTAHPLELRLQSIAQGLRAVLEAHGPDAAAVEGVAIDGLPVVHDRARIFADEIRFDLLNRRGAGEIQRRPDHRLEA